MTALLYKNRFNILNNKIILVPFGDIHYGHKNVDIDLLKKNLDWIHKTKNVYVLGMGDMVESATKASIGAGVFEQDEHVQGQLEKIVDMLLPIAKEGRLLGLLQGNHEERIYKYSGLNITKIMAKMLKTKYLGYSADIRLRVGTQTYTVHASHGSSGATTIAGKLNPCMKMAQFSDAEIYLMGHVHDLICYKKAFFRQDTRNKMLEQENKYFVLTGSYLTYFGGYAEMKNLLPSNLGSPKIKLHSNEHEVRVSI